MTAGAGAFVRTVWAAADNVPVADMSIGDDAWIAASSLITEDVHPGVPATSGASELDEEGRRGHRND